jgi:hypothetical protein
MHSAARRATRAALIAALVASAALTSRPARAAGDEDGEDDDGLTASSTAAATHPRRRDAAELVPLYFTSIAWGGSITLFVDGLTYAGKPYAGADFSVLLVPITAGLGALLPTVIDLAYDHRSGVPQTVATSMVLGLGEAIALNEYFSNRAVTSFHTFTKDASWVFGGLTAGLATGLLVGQFVHTTPGRAAWVTTTGLFGGVFAASLAGAVSRPSDYPSTPFDREGIRNVGLAGAMAGAAGIAVGLSSATALSPSVLRAYLIDLGWMVPTAISGIACMKCRAPETFTAMAVSGGVGFLASFLGTIPMKHVGLADPKTLPPAPAEASVAPYAMPLPSGGFEVGLGGSLR